MAADDAILKKVRKLLALADPERGGSEAERDLAFKRAQELMFKHGLAMMDVEREEQADGVTEERVTVQGVTKQWKGLLLFRVAAANFVSTVRIPYGRNLTVWALIGQPENVAFTRSLTDALIPWLELEATQQVALHMPHNAKAFKRAFFDRAGRLIQARLIAQRRDFERDAGAKGTELVRVQDAANRAYMEKQWPDLRQSRARNYSNTSGAVAGVDAGRRADLSVGRKLRADSRKSLGKGS